MTAEPAVASEEAATGASSRVGAYPYYVLGILFLTYVVSYVDRRILTILQEHIKHDLGLSDTQLGLMTGLAFGIFYATLGIPIARLADRSSRRNIIAISLGLWSVMTAVCGFCQNFIQIFLARIGVGVGEAGSGPPSHSMIADYFAHGKRAFALGIYSLGITVGTLIGLAGGGWLNDAFDWRTAFMVVGLPGVLLAVVILLTVREPPRAPRSATLPDGTADTFFSAFRQLWRIPTFRLMAFAGAANNFASAAISDWAPPFFIREYQMSTTDIGLALGLIVGIGGSIGVFFGGFFSDLLGRRNMSWGYCWFPAIAMICAVPFYLGIFVAPTAFWSLFFYTIPTVLTTIFVAPVFGTVQTLAPVHLRALAAAVLLFIINIIGQGAGPFVAGVLSDLILPFVESDAMSIRYSLMIMSLTKAASAGLFLWAGFTIRQDMAAAQKG